MALGDYVKNTYINNSAPGISAARLNNNENKTDELDIASTAQATAIAVVNDIVSNMSGEVDDLGDIVSTVSGDVDSILAVKLATITATWTGSVAPFTQTITVSGVTVNDEPIISPVYSTTNATAILQKSAWNSIGKIITNAGSITCTCFEAKPVTAIPIQMKGV